MTNKQIVCIENGFALVLSFIIYMRLDFPIWWFFALLFVPDITMLGYLINKKVGTIVYNYGHTFIFPLILGLCYLYFSKDYLLVVSIVWVAHICLDRALGMGLKYQDSFTSTHIQKL